MTEIRRTRVLTRSLHRQNEFLATLAHEIRNPLAAIRNSVAVLRLAEGDPQAKAAAQGAIDRQMDHLVRLVEDLLDIARINRGKLVLRRRRSDLRQALEQALEACRPVFREHQQTLAISVPETPVYVYGDATRLTQLIGNLLSNANKFTASGGAVRITMTLENAEAVLRIRDNGIGIATENLPRLFEMFSQLDHSLERTQRGLGIGLNLVRRLVEMHGGRIEAHSDGIGRGSEFVVYLPTLTAAEDVVSAAAAGLVPTAAAENGHHDVAALVPSPRLGRRILVVDDNVDSVDSLAILLRLQGHHVEVAHDGLEAVEMAVRTLPDVVLLDIGLPGLNGYDAARRIRQSPGGSAVQLIALTGWGQEEDRKLAQAAGFDQHLVKPVHHDRLMALLAQPWQPPTAVVVESTNAL